MSYNSGSYYNEPPPPSGYRPSGPSGTKSALAKKAKAVGTKMFNDYRSQQQGQAHGQSGYGGNTQVGQGHGGLGSSPYGAQGGHGKPSAKNAIVGLIAKEGKKVIEKKLAGRKQGHAASGYGRENPSMNGYGNAGYGQGGYSQGEYGHDNTGYGR